MPKAVPMEASASEDSPRPALVADEQGQGRYSDRPRLKLRSKFSAATFHHPNNHPKEAEDEAEEESEAVVDAQPGRGHGGGVTGCGADGTLSRRQFALFSAGGRPALEADEQRLAKAKAKAQTQAQTQTQAQV
ncbi:hypothetical protein CFAM422_006294 [Trichoderma lentiforme]|uniref:Uncharacterized protein n=1 Tax=Trichoderma lentiforme TaxID=1567552 RepID=A0A9P4XGG5_9HYPO|nr:hypothetical protein CFAM422_006294 [Trichoderma lentiforme]